MCHVCSGMGGVEGAERETNPGRYGQGVPLLHGNHLLRISHHSFSRDLTFSFLESAIQTMLVGGTNMTGVKLSFQNDNET